MDIKDQNEKLVLNQKLWKDFSTGYWTLFLCHWIIKGVAYMYKDDLTVYLVGLVLTVLVAIIMVWHIGRYSFKFSKNRKKAILKSFLGLIWFGGFLIFIAYGAVAMDYHRATGRIK